MSQKKIISGVAFSWVRFLLGFVVTLIQTPLYFKYLSKDVVGIWFLFFSAAAFMQMSDFGLPSAVNRAIAYIKNKKVISVQPESKFYFQFSVKDIYLSSFMSFIVIAFVIVSIGTVLILTLKPDFGATQVSSKEISLSFAVFLIGVFFNMTASIPNACLNGLGDVGYDNLFRIIVQVIGLVLIWIFLPLYNSILVLTLIYLLQGIISTFFIHWFLRHKHRDMFRTRGTLNVSLVKQLYKESIPLFVNQVGSWFTNQSGIWIATFILGASQIADYSVVIQIVFYGLSLSLSIPSAINPFATTAFSEGGVNDTHKYFFVTLKSSTYIVGFWIIILAVWGEPILNLWIGSGHFLGILILIPLLVNLFLEMQHSVCGGFVWNTGKWPFVPATIAAGFLNVLFCFIGCHYWGFTGLAVGTMLAKLFTLNWYAVYYALKRLNISRKVYIKSYLFRVLLVISLTIPLAMALKVFYNNIQVGFTFRNLPGNVLISLLTGFFISLLVWSVAYYFYILNNEERNLYKNILGKIYHGLRH